MMADGPDLEQRVKDLEKRLKGLEGKRASEHTFKSIADLHVRLSKLETDLKNAVRTFAKPARGSR